MLLSKRIKKLQKLTSLQPQEDTQPPRNVKDHKKSLRCRFTEIPPPSKYLSSNSVYFIYGDIPLMYYNGGLATEISLYNESKNFKDITVTQIAEQRVITIKTSLKTDKSVPDWNELMDTLTQTNDEEMSEWVKSIKLFSHTYSKVMQRQSRKKMKSEPRKQFFYKVTDQTKIQDQYLFENYPCLKLKFRIKNHQNQLKEIVANEDFVKELGYSIENFVTVILQEGFPQIMPYDNPLASVVIKSLVKNYFTIGEQGFEVGELTCPLLMKNNFTKNMKFKAYFLMNYEDTVFGMDLIIAITSAEEPYLLPKRTLSQEISPDFVELMSSHEKEMVDFVSGFYDQMIKQYYTGFFKTCLLKEIQCKNISNNSDNNTDAVNNKEDVLFPIKHE